MMIRKKRKVNDERTVDKPLLMKDKRGMFFTIIAIALLSLLAVSITTVSLSEKRHSISKRIGTLNDYVYSLEEDLPRKLYIATFRIVFLLEKRIVENGTYLNNIENLTKEAFFNETIQGSATSEEESLLSGVTYNDIKQDLTSQGEKLNLEINLSNPTLTIDQTDPWHIRTVLKVDLYVRDKGELASWNRTNLTITEYIPIQNFEDPLYIVNTNGLLNHKMRPTNYTGFIGPGNDTTNLTGHITNHYYIATNESPSFINRLEGNNSAHPQGIESLIYIPDLTNNGLTVEDKSIVDHIYFSTNDPATKTVTSMPTWFKIDNASEERYNLTGLTV